jgi:hypothetical protein
MKGKKAKWDEAIREVEEIRKDPKTMELLDELIKAGTS